MAEHDAGPLLVILTGPSGVGKDTIIDRMEALDRPYHFSVNATTRPPRPEETEGIDYYFVSKDRFEAMIRDGELLEHATVYGDHKGVPKAPIREALAAGKDVLMRTDVQGARYIKSICPGAVTIFLLPPSWGELEWRLRSRATDSAQQLKLRLRTAKEEMAMADEFDHTVVNDDLNATVDAIERIIAAERARPGRAPVVV